MWGIVMALRTYLPTLRVIARSLCGYIRRHDEKIREYIGTENEAALDAVLVACDALEAILDVIIVEGS